MDMKALLVLALSSLCATAMADEIATDAASQQMPVEEYTYSTDLDIAKVVSMSEIPNVCEVVPTRMEYERGISIVGYLGRLIGEMINA